MSSLWLLSIQHKNYALEEVPCSVRSCILTNQSFIWYATMQSLADFTALVKVDSITRYSFILSTCNELCRCFDGRAVVFSEFGRCRTTVSHSTGSSSSSCLQEDALNYMALHWNVAVHAEPVYLTVWCLLTQPHVNCAIAIFSASIQLVRETECELWWYANSRLLATFTDSLHIMNIGIDAILWLYYSIDHSSPSSVQRLCSRCTWCYSAIWF